MVTIAESYVHSLNPIIFELPGGLAVRWYGVSYVMGFIAAWLLLKWMAKTNRILIAPEQVGDFMMYAIAGVVIGGRLGFCLFYDLPRAIQEGVTPLLWNFTSTFPFWGVLRFTGGGMASHGGIIGVILGCFIFARRNKISFLHVCDFAAIATPIGLGLGRIANFINGELWGKALPTTMRANPPSWSIKYPYEVVENWRRVVTISDGEELRELVLRMSHDFGLDAASFDVLKTQVIAEASQRLEAVEQLRSSLPATGDFHVRVIEAAYAGNASVLAVLKPQLTPYYPSQLIQAFAEGLLLIGAIVLIWWKPRRIGTISVTFLIVYALLRIATELFRQPDEGVAVILGLQRGQLLSVLMFAVAGGITVWIVRRKPDRLGGLGVRPSSPTT